MATFNLNEVYEISENQSTEVYKSADFTGK